MGYVVAALYQFAPLEDLPGLKSRLAALCRAQGVCGTLLLAAEGINGTVAGSREGIDALKDFLGSVKGLDRLEYKESRAEEQPFHRMKVRIKQEIVTIGLPDIDPNRMAGKYVEPAAWNTLISDPDTIVIDTRNDYEVDIGTFQNARDPRTKTFREFPAWVDAQLHNQKHRKVAMFCTGGIRCEKASSYMKSAGFDEVYHLKGGILKYLETVPEAQSLWRGDCFVFDQRVAVGQGLLEKGYVMCPSCRLPVSAQAQRHVKYEDGICCPACADNLTAEQRARAMERHKQMQLAAARGERHLGAEYAAEGGGEA